jgi:hypothetical protein
MGSLRMIITGIHIHCVRREVASMRLKTLKNIAVKTSTSRDFSSHILQSVAADVFEFFADDEVYLLGGCSVAGSRIDIGRISRLVTYRLVVDACYVHRCFLCISLSYIAFGCREK